MRVVTNVMSRHWKVSSSDVDFEAAVNVFKTLLLRSLYDQDRQESLETFKTAERRI